MPCESEDNMSRKTPCDPNDSSLLYTPRWFAAIFIAPNSALQAKLAH
jgi:hypothetical protein